LVPVGSERVVSASAAAKQNAKGSKCDLVFQLGAVLGAEGLNIRRFRLPRAEEFRGKRKAREFAGYVDFAKPERLDANFFEVFGDRSDIQDATDGTDTLARGNWVDMVRTLESFVQDWPKLALAAGLGESLDEPAAYDQAVVPEVLGV